MSQIEKLAVPIMILFVASSVAANMVRFFGNQLLHEFDWSALTLPLATVPLTVIVLAVRIFIAFWLFRLAKEESASRPCLNWNRRCQRLAEARPYSTITLRSERLSGLPLASALNVLLTMYRTNLRFQTFVLSKPGDSQAA